MFQDTCLLPLATRNLIVQGPGSCGRAKRLINDNKKQVGHTTNEKQYNKQRINHKQTVPKYSTHHYDHVSIQIV
jgi:hypothetical protein